MDLALCTFYLLFGFAEGAFRPFLNLYYFQTGLSGTQVGLLSSLMPLTSLLAQPIWGTIADRSRERRSVIRLLLVGAIAALAALSLAQGFWPLAAITIGIAAFHLSITPILDSTALDYLGSRSLRGYGRIRAFQSLGFAASVLLCGLIAQVLSFPWAFRAGAAFLLTCFLLSVRLPSTAGRPRLKKVWGVPQLLALPAFRLLLAFAFIASLAFAAGMSFFTIYLSRLGMDSGSIGLAWTVAGLSEVALMALSGKLMGRLGTRLCLASGPLTFAVRFSLYSAFPFPAAALGAQLLHGLSFGLYYTAAVNQVNQTTPAELRSTAQTLYWAGAAGAGSILGSAAGGIVFDRFGTQILYLLCALICVLSIPLLLLLRREEQRQAITRPA